MDRRTYLSLLPVVLAGCSGADETATESATPSSTRTSASTPTARPTRTPTETETATPTETESGPGAESAPENGNNTEETTETEQTTETETETETEEPTPTGEERAADLIATAEGHLADAVDAYVGSNESWLAVDGSHGVDRSRIDPALTEAESDLDDAAIHATDDQQLTIAEFQHLVGYVQRVVEVHDLLHHAWVKTRDGLATGRREDFETAESTIDDATAAAADAEEGLDDLRDDERQMATEVTSVFSREAYSGKIDLLDDERESVVALSDVYGRLESGLVELADATADFKEERYDHAAIKYWAAYQEFTAGLETLPDEPGDAYAEIVSDQQCFLKAVDSAARNLESASKNDGHRVKEQDAVDALEGCQLVDDSPTASGLRDWLDGRR